MFQRLAAALLGLFLPSLVHAGGAWVPAPGEPDDRFGTNRTFSFNRASMGRVGAGLIVPFGPGRLWNVELGYNKWIWGRSARRYQEPYFSIGRAF